MKAISPISGKEGEYRTEEWAVDNGYLQYELTQSITDADQFNMIAHSPYIADFNESMWEMEIEGKIYIVKRK